MFFKKLEEVPAYYWEEKSYMMIIPKTDKDLLKKTIDNLESTKEIKVLDKKTDIAKQTINFKIKYERCEYEIGMYVGGVSVPDYYLNNLALTDAEKKEILDSISYPAILHKAGHILLAISSTQIIHAYGDAKKVILSSLNCYGTNLYPLLTSISCIIK